MFGAPAAFEQRAAIESGGTLERFRAAVGREPLERRDVDVHGVRAQAHGVTFCHEAGGTLGIALFREAGLGRRRQAVTQHEKGLSHAVAGPLARDVAPQQCRQGVSRVHLSRAEREIGEERLRLLPRQDDGRAGLETRLERAEQGEFQHSHAPCGGL